MNAIYLEGTTRLIMVGDRNTGSPMEDMMEIDGGYDGKRTDQPNGECLEAKVYVSTSPRDNGSIDAHGLYLTIRVLTSST